MRDSAVNLRMLLSAQRKDAGRFRAGSSSWLEQWVVPAVAGSSPARFAQEIEMFEDEAIEAIKALNKAGSPSFITCESKGPDGPYQVVCKFRSMGQSHKFYQALIQCGEVANAIESEEQASKRKTKKTKEKHA